MKENKERNSRKRLNSLILLVAFTAILLIVSTYAWFSTQRNVSLSGLEGKVKVAEGLQISLDALNWRNEIDLSDSGIIDYFAQTNGNLGSEDPSFRTLEKPYDGRTNIIPTDYKPVSTTADANEGIGLADFNMYNGVNTGVELKTIAKAPMDKTGGYYAIDFFLQNSSAESSETTDLLQLVNNSAVRLNGVDGRPSTGIQNTFRVAFAQFDDDGNAANVTVENTPNQKQILESTTGVERKITDVAIWEPNASGAEVKSDTTVTTFAAHVDYIVQNNNKITFSSGDKTKYGIDSTGKFKAEQALPTYALTTASVSKTITDVYDWDTGVATNGLKFQNTLKTANTGFKTSDIGSTQGADPNEEGAHNLLSVKDGTSNFTIPKGKYVRMRMYVWIEGQDVDCINYASLGGKTTLDIGLTKPATTAEAKP